MQKWKYFRVVVDYKIQLQSLVLHNKRTSRNWSVSKLKLIFDVGCIFNSKDTGVAV